MQCIVSNIWHVLPGVVSKFWIQNSQYHHLICYYVMYLDIIVSRSMHVFFSVNVLFIGS